MATKSARKRSRDNSTRLDALKTSALAGSLKKLSGNDLLKRLKTFRGSELAVLLEILRCLNEVERRRLYVPHGYGSLYDLCTNYLKYSRTAAWRRIHAARCIERFPSVAKLLRSGELSLTVVSMISRILTKENAEDIISYARGRSTREVEMLVSQHRPGFMLRDRVRPVCLMVPDVTKNDSCRISGAGKNSTQHVDINILKNQGVHQGAGSIFHNGAATANVSSIPDPGDTALAVTAASAGCKADSQNIERVLITQKFKLEFAVDPEFMEKLARIKSLLSTKYPKEMGFEKVFDILMDEYIDRHGPVERHRRRNARRERERSKNALLDNKNKNCPEDIMIDSARKSGERCTETTAPGCGTSPGEKQRGTKPTGGDRRQKNPHGELRRNTRRDSGKRGRHIPPAIRDEVFVRDGGRCTFIGDDGKRCNSYWNLQIGI